MKISEGEMVAWELTADILPSIDANEQEFLCEIVESFYSTPSLISASPGAFDYDVAALQSTAIAIFGVVAAHIKDIAPKLFDAVLEVGKDTTKKILAEKLKTSKSSSDSSPATPAQLHELIRVAALERKINPLAADAIANAVVARLAIMSPKHQAEK